MQNDVPDATDLVDMSHEDVEDILSRDEEPVHAPTALFGSPGRQSTSRPVSWTAPGFSLPRPPAKVALVHEWLERFAGSERVFEQLLLCFPDADLFAVVDFMPPESRRFLGGRPVRTSFIQKLPYARRFFRHYLGLMPLAVQQLDLSAYDLVISSSHAVAKGVITGPDQLHVSYVHSPMRYIWDLQHQYLREAGLARRLHGLYARWLFARLRQWDVSVTHQVDVLVANSRYIARRIRKAYRRDATVIHPPVDLERFTVRPCSRDYYLLACRFVPYKRADLVIDAFARSPGRRLVVVGDGPDAKKMHRAGAGAANIEFRGSVGQEELVHLMQGAKALVFAAEEDFGITLVEAQACGTPVIAYRKGGASDIVVTAERPDPTGVLFATQDVDALCRALDQFERFQDRFHPDACRANAARFSGERFRANILDLVGQLLEERSLAGNSAF